jgi:xanthine dehydrogenase accessory factor
LTIPRRAAAARARLYNRGEMYEILDDVTAELEAGRPFALVTLVADQGSTPRAAGAEMLVREDGSIAGTIGGGLLEHAMMRAAAQALVERSPRRERLDLGGTDLASGDRMVCGGAAETLIAFVPPADAELAAACACLREARDAGRRAWFVTVPPADDPGSGAPGRVEHCVLDEAGALEGATICGVDDLRKLTAAAALHGTATLPDGRVAIMERVEPPSLAVVCGAGHVGRAVAPLLAGLGFRVVVVDDREEFASAERFPGVEVVVRPFEGALEAVGVDERAYVVVVTRGHVHDLGVLEQALRLRACYAGVMGSRSKRARMLTALATAGFNDEAIAGVHTPIGLGIGAETPAELAVSIAAEIVQVRSGRSG